MSHAIMQFSVFALALWSNNAAGLLQRSQPTLRVLAKTIQPTRGWRREEGAGGTWSDLVVLVGLSSGTTVVNMEVALASEPTMKKAVVRGSAGSMNNHELFTNWLKFVPGYVKPRVHVLCADEASRQHVASVSHNISSRLSHEMASEPSMGHWKWRVSALHRLLREGKTVLVSDLDAVWLKDPLPLLEDKLESVVGMREFTGWHTLNCGFVLFRPEFVQMASTWLQAIDSMQQDDQPVFDASFLHQVSWSEQGTMSVGTHRDYKIRLLPVHQFPRNFVTMPGCSHCKADIKDQNTVSFSSCCVDDQVVVLHHKGEIFREYSSGRKYEFPSVWKL